MPRGTGEELAYAVLRSAEDLHGIAMEARDVVVADMLDQVDELRGEYDYEDMNDETVTFLTLVSMINIDLDSVADMALEVYDIAERLWSALEEADTEREVFKGDLEKLEDVTELERKVERLEGKIWRTNGGIEGKYYKMLDIVVADLLPQGEWRVYVDLLWDYVLEHQADDSIVSVLGQLRADVKRFSGRVLPR